MVDIGEIYTFLGSEVVAHACYVDNSHISWLRNSCCGEQAWQQVVGEEGVGEVVGLPLGFVAVLGFLEGDGHDSGVVNEDIKTAKVLGNALSCAVDRLLIRDIELN